ncbi:hypothetical protein D3C77_531660 [compost metagenome]
MDVLQQIIDDFNRPIANMLFPDSERNQVGKIVAKLLNSVLQLKLIDRFKPLLLRKRRSLLAAELPLDMLGIDDSPAAHIELFSQYIFRPLKHIAGMEQIIILLANRDGYRQLQRIADGLNHIFPSIMPQLLGRIHKYTNLAFLVRNQCRLQLFFHKKLFHKRLQPCHPLFHGWVAARTALHIDAD